MRSRRQPLLVPDGARSRSAIVDVGRIAWEWIRPHLEVDRRSVEHALVSAKRRREQVGMLFLDLDDFKDVNDTMGHDTGDRLLQTVADRIRAVCRAMDTPARRGGDEIALLPEGSVSAKALTLLAERLLEAIRAPLTLNRVQLIPGASAVGIALRGGGATTEELLREADVAIYHAKRAGERNVVMFRSEM